MRDELARISRQLGADATLVLAGGGNTSCKAIEPDLLGREREVMHIKPSGADLATIEADEFSTLRLDDLRPLREFDALDDASMMRHAMAALTDPAMKRPSLEVLLHAFLPQRWVLHSHADALLAVCNHPQGERRVRNTLGDDVAVVAYRRPGFELAKMVAETGADAIVLMKHGLVTCGETADEAYRRHLEIVKRCRRPPLELAGEPDDPFDLLPELRGEFGGGMLRWDSSPFTAGFLQDPALVAALQRGPATADHLLRVGRAPRIVEGRRFLVAHGATLARAEENLQILLHTVRMVGPDWEPLNDEQLRHVEEWELQNDKAAAWEPDGELAGKVALVTGAASGIGRAIAERFESEGAQVVRTDVDEGDWIVGDIGEEETVDRAIDFAVRSYGGLDIVVSNAGVAKPAPIEELSLEDWEKSFAVNARAHFLVARAAMKILRRQGLGGSIIFNASKNVLAPGKGFAAYSAAKAAEAQLAKVLALEAAEIGVRVNTLHPDAVFAGTRLWSDEVRQERAAAHGVPVEELEEFYAARNLLKVPVRPEDVAEAALFFASERSSRTTGAYLTVDGGVKEAFGR
ncbi:MAG: SDR family oxidoreductase [Planctomycetota bacterium]|jgi:NAD(P)-dependent dehydrogenase (short-subunit alcohol dehydrogenase family)/ribulose-5-phosphate 4-epimerase/fuculose-1-phosphate aldolase